CPTPPFSEMAHSSLSLPLRGQRAPSLTGARSPRLRRRRGHSLTCPLPRGRGRGVRGHAGPEIKPLTLTLSQRERGLRKKVAQASAVLHQAFGEHGLYRPVKGFETLVNVRFGMDTRENAAAA